ncbi:A-kinase anchor protein 10, mitochondrial [Eurosta solidaginis]|uniref:A-kinase anchor protein 10, mitochondrial n=1 Tax=Eurosta solidaginis TaxID=178769 RepID=UPI003530852F
MLNYLKKRKGLHRHGIWSDDSFNKSDAQIKNNDTAENESTHNKFGIKRNSLKSTSSFCDEILAQSEIDDGTVDGVGSCGGSLRGYSLVSDDDIFRYTSRLAMPLSAIVCDPNCLSCFVQYLDTRQALALLKFCLDTENFKTAAAANLEKKQTAEQTSAYLNGLTQQAEDKNKTTTHCDLTYEVGKPTVANATNVTDRVPELKNYYDLSMRQPLTDDEKSQIYAETNKQIHECNESLTLNKGNTGYTNGNPTESTESQTDCCDEKSSTNSPPTNDLKMHRINVENCVGPASVKDAISIYQKYLMANASHFVLLPVSILSQISLMLCQRSERVQEVCLANTTDKEDVRTIPATCFDEAQRYVMAQLERMYLNDFLQSSFYSKYCLEIIENGEPELSISDILYSETTLFYFMEFLEQHGERECLDFWTSAINFRKSYETVNEDAENTCDSMHVKDKNQKRTSIQSEAQTDAMIIYEKFFSLQSEERFWLSDRLRSRVEEQICANGRIAYCFDLPLQLIAKYLDCKYLPDFLKSQIFQNYLKELKLKSQDMAASTDSQKSRTVPTGGVFRKSLHRKTFSDCSEGNKREALKHNTLLAMDGNKLPHTCIKNLQQTTGSDLHIDARQLTNPNLLWRRSYSTGGGGLKFGHINELGRFERDFEAVDALSNELASGGKHSWSLNFSGNKIKNAMRKLVNLPEDKVQEEIAWQVAEMIVKDVTNVTLKNEQIKPTLPSGITRNKDVNGAMQRQ